MPRRALLKKNNQELSFLAVSNPQLYSGGNSLKIGKFLCYNFPVFSVSLRRKQPARLDRFSEDGELL
jgi:hypothetical protein